MKTSTTPAMKVETELRAVLRRQPANPQHAAIAILLNDAEPADRQTVCGMIAEIMALRNAGVVLAFEIVAKTLAWEASR